MCFVLPLKRLVTVTCDHVRGFVSGRCPGYRRESVHALYKSVDEETCCNKFNTNTNSHTLHNNLIWYNIFTLF